MAKARRSPKESKGKRGWSAPNRKAAASKTAKKKSTAPKQTNRKGKHSTPPKLTPAAQWVPADGESFYLDVRPAERSHLGSLGLINDDWVENEKSNACTVTDGGWRFRPKVSPYIKCSAKLQRQIMMVGTIVCLRKAAGDLLPDASKALNHRDFDEVESILDSHYEETKEREQARYAETDRSGEWPKREAEIDKEDRATILILRLRVRLPVEESELAPWKKEMRLEACCDYQAYCERYLGNDPEILKALGKLHADHRQKYDEAVQAKRDRIDGLRNRSGDREAKLLAEKVEGAITTRLRLLKVPRDEPTGIDIIDDMMANSELPEFLAFVKNNSWDKRSRTKLKSTLDTILQEDPPNHLEFVHRLESLGEFDSSIWNRLSIDPERQPHLDWLLAAVHRKSQFEWSSEFSDEAMIILGSLVQDAWERKSVPIEEQAETNGKINTPPDRPSYDAYWDEVQPLLKAEDEWAPRKKNRRPRYAKRLGDYFDKHEDDIRAAQPKVIRKHFINAMRQRHQRNRN